jgi:hypothetical protein
VISSSEIRPDRPRTVLVGMPPPKLLLLELPAPRSPLHSVWISDGATLRQPVSTGPSAAIISAMLLPLCDSLITFHLSSLSTSGGTSTACLPLRWRLPRISEGVRTVDGKGMPLMPGDGITTTLAQFRNVSGRDETRNGWNSDRNERVDEYIKASKQHRSSRVPPSPLYVHFSSCRSETYRTALSALQVPVPLCRLPYLG